MGLAGASAGAGIGSSLIGGLKGQQQSDQNNAELNQFINQDQSIIKGNQSTLAGDNTAIQGLSSKLANFNGLSPQQITALSSSLTSAGNNNINTFKSDVGGVANPALLIQQMQNQNAQTGMQNSQQLGAQANQEELAGMQTAGGLLNNQQSTLTGQDTSLMGSLLGTTAAAAEQNGNPWGQALGGIGQNLTTLGAANQKSSMK
jgi:hypothetical protein